MAPVAEQLLADVKELRAKVRTIELQAVQIANGANEGSPAGPITRRSNA
jgi:iron uptake system EfeUOB component EfeO/EfeM